MSSKPVSKMTPEEHEIHLQKRREYYYKNREYFLTKNKEYYNTNKDRYLAYQKNYLHTHPEVKKKQRLADKECREKRGSEYIKKYMKHYREQNRNNINEKERIYGFKRRHQKNLKQEYYCIFTIINTYNNRMYISSSKCGYYNGLYKLYHSLEKNNYSNIELQKDYIQYKKYFKNRLLWRISFKNNDKLAKYLFITKLFFSMNNKLYNKEIIDFENFEKFKKSIGRLWRL